MGRMARAGISLESTGQEELAAQSDTCHLVVEARAKEMASTKGMHVVDTIGVHHPAVAGWIVVTTTTHHISGVQTVSLWGKIGAMTDHMSIQWSSVELLHL
mmetsp:Transcript_30460/g.71052  ORF Transcript_30460/g.71052 Transcript_30460/m.71052 type:complete len:101 (+) Transcript_30460:156-458(+)